MSGGIDQDEVASFFTSKCMKMENNTACQELTNQLSALIGETTRVILQAFPDLEKRYGREGVERCKEDVRFHFNYLHSAICMEEKELFADYVAWVRDFFKQIKLPSAYTDRPFEIMTEVSASMLEPGLADHIAGYIRHALSKTGSSILSGESFISGDNHLSVLATQYVNSLLRRERPVAEKLISDALESGVPVRDVYLNVFQPAQLEIGRLWQENEITVAMEHYFTAATQFIMSQHYRYIFSSEKKPLNMVATSISGELHELGIRMVSDFFEMDGWHTTYLGSNTPDKAVVDMLKMMQPDLIAISATIPFNLPNVGKLIGLIRSELEADAPRIMVGGRAFSNTPDLWRKMDADGFATDADGAVKTALELIK